MYAFIHTQLTKQTTRILVLVMANVLHVLVQLLPKQARSLYVLASHYIKSKQHGLC